MLQLPSHLLPRRQAPPGALRRRQLPRRWHSELLLGDGRFALWPERDRSAQALPVGNA